MNRNKRNSDERQALLNNKTSLYNDQHNEHDTTSIRIGITSPLTDTLDDKHNINRKPSRLEWAQSSWTRWIYILLFSWLDSIMNLGYKQTLTHDDFDDLHHQDKCS